MDRVNHSLLKKIPLRGLWRLTAASLFTVATTAAAASNQAILEGERFHPVQGKNGMVATSHTLASEVALQVTPLVFMLVAQCSHRYSFKALSLEAS